MPDSSHSQSSVKSGGSKSNFPFASVPAPIAAGNETVINPERRQPGDGSSHNGPRPDSELQYVLFPDFSRLEAGELPRSPAGIQLAHFEIVDRIGAGGMGSVFLALDTHLQRYVALKILSPSQAREHNSIQRFLNEARAAARLDYDGIARVHFYGEDRGFHFIAFEYVTGTNLRDMIQARGALANSDAVNYTLQVAHALKYTSAAGVVHRDIKPSNIIVTPSGRAKLVDLGLARKESSESIDDLTVAGTTLGTFDYISPEQAQDPRNVDVRSDIYSLGCTLFHMLTGEPPYPQGTLAQKLLEHQQSYVPDPASRNRRVPAELSAIVKRMMASDPKKRYQSPEALIRDLLQVAERLGLRGTTTEGLVWSSQRNRSRAVLASYLSWMVAGAVVLMLAFFVDRFLPEGNKNPLSDELAKSSTSPSQNIDNGTGKVDASEESGDRNSSPINPIEPVAIAESTEGNLPGSNSPNAATPDKSLFKPTEPESIFAPSPGSLDKPELITGDQSPRLTPETTANSVVEPSSPVTATTPVPTPMTSADTNVDAGTNKVIFLQQPGIAEPLTFDTLESACAEAKDGSVIELRFDGPRPGEPEKPITINRRVKIHAAPGYRPEVRFASRRDAEETDLQMFTLQAGALELSNVAITLTINDAPSSGSRNNWSLFSLQGSEQLQLQNVVATIVNPRGYPAALIELSKGTAVEMKPMVGANPTDASETFDIAVFESILRGESEGVLVKSTRPGNIAITRSMLALQHGFCEVSGSSDMPPEAEFLNLNFDHVSCLLQGSLFKVDTGEIREILPLNVASRNSYFVQRPIETAPLISMAGNKDAVDFRDELLWRGEKNFYDGFEVFWAISDTAGASDVEDLYFEGWQAHWADTFGGSEDASVASVLAWKNDWTQKPFSQLLASDTELTSNNDTGTMDAAIRATDGTTIGAPVDSIGFSPLP